MRGDERADAFVARRAHERCGPGRPPATQGARPRGTIVENGSSRSRRALKRRDSEWRPPACNEEYTSRTSSGSRRTTETRPTVTHDGAISAPCQRQELR